VTSSPAGRGQSPSPSSRWCVKLADGAPAAWPWREPSPRSRTRARRYRSDTVIADLLDPPPQPRHCFGMNAFWASILRPSSSPLFPAEGIRQRKTLAKNGPVFWAQVGRLSTHRPPNRSAETSLLSQPSAVASRLFALFCRDPLLYGDHPSIQSRLRRHSSVGLYGTGQPIFDTRIPGALKDSLRFSQSQNFRSRGHFAYWEKERCPILHSCGIALCVDVMAQPAKLVGRELEALTRCKRASPRFNRRGARSASTPLRQKTDSKNHHRRELGSDNFY
jgi:hypothetical protein